MQLPSLGQILPVEIPILLVLFAHIVLLSRDGTPRVRRITDQVVKVSGSVYWVALVGITLVLVASLLLLQLLPLLLGHSIFSVKVFLELMVQLFGLLSLANIVMAHLSRGIRTSVWLNIAAGLLFVFGAVCGNIFKLYVAEGVTDGLMLALTAIGFLTSVLAILTLLAYTWWLTKNSSVMGASTTAT